MRERISSERRLFQPRSGESVDAYLNILSRPSEHPLGDDEWRQVINFEHGLMSGLYTKSNNETINVNEERSLEIVADESKYLASRHEIVADYFLSDEGHRRAANCGITIAKDATAIQALNSIRMYAGNADRTLLERRDTLKELASMSNEWAISQLIAELLEEDMLDSLEFTRAMVFDDTSRLRNAVQSYEAYRTFYLKVRADLSQKNHEDPVVGAQSVISDIYLKVINGELAALYPDMLWAWDQVNAADDKVMKRDLRLAWPSGEYFASMNPETRQHYIRALDQIRNGAAYHEGRPTAINQELRDLFNQENRQEKKEPAGGRFTVEEYESLSAIKLDADGMRAFCKDVLSELGLLSMEPEESYYSDRSHRAADDKWQVVIKDDASAMSVGDPEGVLKIPSTFNRNITKITAPVGVVSGAAHEIMHIYQLNNCRNSQGLRLANSLRGRSSLVLREAGGIYAEHLVQAELFGRVRPDSPHYMRAIELLESGGGEKQAIKAFYESYRVANPQESLDDCVRVAESRVKRLCRRYGGFNSQPLNYVQSASFVAAAVSMNESQKNMIFAEGAFDLPDMVALHQYGLLSDNTNVFPMNTFCDIIERKLRKMIEGNKI